MADFTQLISQFLYSRLPQISGGGGSASGVLTVSTTSAGTAADTNETDLWTYSMPANTLGADGRAVRVTAWGTFGATANTKTPRLYFGTDAVLGTSSTENGTGWKLSMVVFRTGASAQLYHRERVYNSTAVAALFGTGAQDTTAAITIKVSGQNGTAAANDIVFKGALVELLN